MDKQGINTKADCVVWLRRDLRLDDNAALYHALKNYKAVQLIFIFDENILSELPENDARVSYIHSSLQKLQNTLKENKSSLFVAHDKPLHFYKNFAEQFPNAKALYFNNDYEPYAVKRDKAVFEMLSEQNIDVKSYKDHVIFEKDEVLKDDNTPYVVFTPYANKWREKLNDFYAKSYPTSQYFKSFCHTNFTLPSIKSLGFSENNLANPPEYPKQSKISDYSDTRDYPAKNGNTNVSVHLRFGTISIRKLLQKGHDTSHSYVNELIWRDFYQMIIHHFPHSATEEFKSKYAAIPWRKNEDDFKRWKEGKTGVAFVDAGMRELNATGFMHNRVRMIVASFLVKNLLIDWRWGEAYFAEKLLDYELASNVGGWQWAAGCGCDAAPYFRVFNPESQLKKYDPKLEYVKQWVPEFEDLDYKPMVDIKASRKKSIETFKKALS